MPTQCIMNNNDNNNNNNNDVGDSNAENAKDYTRMSFDSNTSTTTPKNESKSTLRLASSEPDLTITMRNYSRQRGDIRDLDWSAVNGDAAGGNGNRKSSSSKNKFGKRSREQSVTSSSNHRIGYLRQKKVKRSKSRLKKTSNDDGNPNIDTGNNESNVMTTTDGDTTCLHQQSVENPRSNPLKPKLQFKKRIKKTLRGTYRLNSNEKRIVHDLYLFSADGSTVIIP
ncbi:unnamed protein product [Trichobilharzia regenti]|nr:unnamed protein product [Trichobilharzia regenti]